MGRRLVIAASYREEDFPDYTIVHLSNRKINKENQEQSDSLPNIGDQNVSNHRYCLDARFASYFRCELLRSNIVKRGVWNNFSGATQTNTIIVHILLIQPNRYQLDHRFGAEIQLLVNETIEMDHIMSCLSTLGGAFSSLGDQFLNCAKTAGNISLQQYKIAEKLGDPTTLLRCQLYLSISLIQCNRFRNARNVITSVYRSMISRPEDLQDKRVISMCLGIWAKLKYHWHVEKNRRKLVNNNIK